MFDYLQKFNSLPKNLRDQVSSPSVMATLMELEKKYQVDLAMTIMKVMIKGIAVKNLASYFVSDFGLNQTNAENLAKDLTAKVFLNVADYLGLEKEVRALDLDADINLIIQEAGLSLSSSELVNRFKSVLSTYLKGVRDKIAARDAFVKPANSGGLNLSAVEADRVFKVCEQKTFKSLEVNLSAINKVPLPGRLEGRLDRIIASADGAKATGEYSLKQAIASGQIKKLEDNRRPEKVEKSEEMMKLPIPEKELNLPKPTTPVTPVAPITHISTVSAASATPIPVAPVASTITPINPPIRPTSSVVKPVAPSASVFSQVFRKIIPTAVPPKSVVSPVIPKAPVIEHKPVVAARPIFAPSISKQAMHDIKPVPKVMGPLEELRFLDLLNFRRLGKTPAEITAKIFSKIKLLEADGYDKMVAGVHAWRQSPVNRLYLKMMQEAIGKGSTVKDFVSTQKDNKDSLNFEEIEAILAMNSKLVF